MMRGRSPKRLGIDLRKRKSPQNAPSAMKETDLRSVNEPPEHTAASGSRRQDESNYHHRNSVLYGSERTRTITTGSIQSSLYGSG